MKRKYQKHCLLKTRDQPLIIKKSLPLKLFKKLKFFFEKTQRGETLIRDPRVINIIYNIHLILKLMNHDMSNVGVALHFSTGQNLLKKYIEKR